jgi:hypothetical protein
MFVQDVEQIQMIHEKHFRDEFEFPDFNRFMGVFIVENGDGIIVAGGVRPIAESVIITDKDIDVMNRVRALHKALDISEYITRSNGFNQLHSFVTEESWMTHLQRNGFIPTRGNALVLNL